MKKLNQRQADMLWGESGPYSQANFNSKNKKEILDERKEVEDDIANLLEDAGSEFTLSDVREAIYNEQETDDMQDIIAMFDTGESNAPDMSSIVDVVSDAWNCFPHKSLNGLSPKEVLLYHEEKDKKRK